MGREALYIHRSTHKADVRALVYYPYTWSASDYDTGDRLDAAADTRVTSSGGTRYSFDFVANHMPGTGRVFVDQATRRALKAPQKAADLAKQHGEQLREANIFKDYDTVIAIGDSGRGPQVARMLLGLLSEGGTEPFTHAVTADSFDTNAPHPPAFTVVRGSVFLLRHAGIQNTAFSVPRRRPRNLALDARAVAYKRAESYALGPMYRTTTETRDALCDLAGQTVIPYLNVALEKGIGGSREQVSDFNETLARIHERAIAANDGIGAPFQALLEPYGHGDLLNPLVTVSHAAGALALTAKDLGAGFRIGT